MNVGYILLLVIFAIFLTCTKEVPIEGSTLPPEPDIVVEHQHGSHIVSSRDKSDNDKYGISDEENGKFDSTADRTNHSRMLTLSSTLGYDEWWFLTTRRPVVFYKDFPGRPGVASWKEISPGSSVENRKSRKMTPTAAGVSSGSQSLTSKYHYTQIIWRAFWMTFLLSCFCWT